MLAGGADLDPATYGAAPHPQTVPGLPERDVVELALATRALERDLPFLGICRGMQVMNVARGGTLIAHLPDAVGHERHRHTPGAFGDHDVTIERGSRLGALLGARAPVKSHHHQGIGRIGADLRAVAWADDGTPEAIEDAGRRFALGVLWHPEEVEQDRVVAALVAAPRERVGA
jgi:gamma-glutamyl-gamma-aminobutyrate hydrolase PuuD